KAPEHSPGLFDSSKNLIWRTRGSSPRILPASVLVVPEEFGKLVVVLGDEIDVALVLERRLRRLQRRVEVVERRLLVLGGHLLVGLDLGDLHLDDGFRD